MPGERIQFELVAGFGNPGHNAGFWFLDELAARHGATFNLDKRFFASVASAQIAGRKVMLVKPMNFMNNSGQGLAAVARFFKIDSSKILVAHDELDLHKSAVSGYVLKRAPADQQRFMDEAIDLALSESDTIIDGDINVATKVLHTHKPDNGTEK